MTTDATAGPLLAAVRRFDRVMGAISGVFLGLANVCLGLMLSGTFVTIALRPFDLSFYWIWPWTMVFFVWMSFIGFFVVYRLGKDIAVDFLVLRLGGWAMTSTRYAVPVLILVVTGAVLAQMPVILESQVGVIDGAVTPWGEIERYTLSIPLGVSCILIFLNAILDIMKALAGLPEPVPSHLSEPDA